MKKYQKPSIQVIEIESPNILAAHNSIRPRISAASEIQVQKTTLRFRLKSTSTSSMTTAMNKRIYLHKSSIVFLVSKLMSHKSHKGGLWDFLV